MEGGEPVDLLGDDRIGLRRLRREPHRLDEQAHDVDGLLQLNLFNQLAGLLLSSHGLVPLAPGGRYVGDEDVGVRGLAPRGILGLSGSCSGKLGRQVDLVEFGMVLPVLAGEPRTMPAARVRLLFGPSLELSSESFAGSMPSMFAAASHEDGTAGVEVGWAFVRAAVIGLAGGGVPGAEKIE